MPTGIAGRAALSALGALWPSRLTVLAYHRVAEPSFFLPNISASPAGFRAQMELVKEVFNPVSLGDLARWLRGEGDLPHSPLLVTFDDGYRDNLTRALPVLRDLGVPASVFLTSGHIGTGSPLPWDLMAYAFGRTERESADLPLLGPTALAMEARDGAAQRFVERAKELTEAERKPVFKGALRALGVEVESGAFEGLYLTWDDVREMAAEGVEFASHTCTHPILTRVPEERARSEIRKSKERIEEETGRKVDAFAYPNGLTGDFSAGLMEVLREEGFESAFTLVPGPQSLSGVRREPMAIRRILISHKDTITRFAAKLSGGQRMSQR